MSDVRTDLPYRPGVGIMLFNAEKKIFVAKRLDMRTEAWQMPQGGIDEGETPEATALRELEEEIGTAKATIIAASSDWYTYDLPATLVPKIWGAKYRGQRQKWYLMAFTGEETDINLQTPDPEFSEYRWVERQTLPSIIVPFKRELYAAVVKEFSPHF